ncbi:hypothetical protein FEE95_20320 [Maribacter algarum]|uniref:Uncharacterized protein n=1 Tax=Maribacter algarum (ex Zhang et al. 2020) TaxID=2578118 RepID=A0A5S3PGY5_9FLAO|nr:family 78 glycoside hydrolase catalytic domain [Maribacter algarum]TMM53408.1 hypothetical protein FEE95_20320 [Maribacter algarum]
MRSLILLFGLLSFCSTLMAQEQDLGNGVKGLWQEKSDQLEIEPWQAQWVWLNDSITSDVLLARKTFNLSSIPETATLRITATSQYQLYINGEYVRRGPARSAPHHQSFDILNITNLLREGKNVMAVRVHKQNEKYSYNLEQRGGLLAQLDMNSNGKTESVVTNSDWKVSRQPSWDNKAPLISRFQQIDNDHVDMRKHLYGWEKFDFNDSSWSNATPLIRTEGWPSFQKNDIPFELATPWTALVPREVPYLLENQIRAENLIEASQIEINNESPETFDLSKKINKSVLKSFKKYETKKGPLEISKTETGKPWFLLFDLGEVVNGSPMLEIQGPSGTKIEVVGAPFMVNEKFTFNIVDSEYRDEIILSGEKDVWEATYFKPYRYLGIIVHNEETPVKLFSFGTRQMKYPFEKKGYIKSKEAPWVNQYMEASAKTIDVCTTDAYTDNYRERRQYAQTGYYAALGNYYIFGDTALQRRYLVQTAQEQQANGIIPAYAPAASDGYMVILDSNCLWIRSLHNYLLYSGDYKTTRELLPTAQKLMQLLDSFTNNLGMIENPPYPYWLDHALLDRRGANLNLNGHYLGALEDFATLLDWLGMPDSKMYIAKAKQLRQSLQQHLWNDEKQLFADALIDGKQSEMFSEHVQAAALALNIATKEQADKIAKQLLLKDNHDYVRRESGLIMVTPAMSYYLHKGLAEYGYIDESLEMFSSRFDKMLAPNTNGTLWEEWRLDGIGRSGKLEMGRTRSDAQTESAFPPAIFAEYLLGVKPIIPGMKEVEIIRTNSSIENIEAHIPSPEGNLYVKWDLMNGAKILELNVPGEMKVKLDLKSLKNGKAGTIKVDGQDLNQDVKMNQYIALEKGKHMIRF